MRILIVEESDFTQLTLLDSFPDGFLEIVWVSTIREAKERLQLESFNVVISEMTLADGDGAEIGKYIVDRLREEFFIFYTSVEIDEICYLYKDRIFGVAKKPYSYQLVDLLYALS